MGAARLCVSGEGRGGEEGAAWVGGAWGHGSPGERKKPPGCTLGCYTGDDDVGDPRAIRAAHPNVTEPPSLTMTPPQPPLRGRVPLSQKRRRAGLPATEYMRSTSDKRKGGKRNSRGGTLIRLTCRRLACSGARVRDPARTMSEDPRLEGPTHEPGFGSPMGIGEEGLSVLVRR